MKKLTIGAVAIMAAALAGFISSYEKITAFADPIIMTEEEADEKHEDMATIHLAAEQTQAGFNAYTLRQLLLQEVELLKVKIRQEDDAEKRADLKRELQSKQEFIRTLDQEEKRQMMKGSG